jgi:hypothetical protein
MSSAVLLVVHPRARGRIADMKKPRRGFPARASKNPARFPARDTLHQFQFREYIVSTIYASEKQNGVNNETRHVSHAAATITPVMTSTAVIVFASGLKRRIIVRVRTFQILNQNAPGGDQSVPDSGCK